MIYYLRHPDIERLRLQALEEWHASLESSPDQAQIKEQVARWSKPLPPPGPQAATPPDQLSEIETILPSGTKPAATGKAGPTGKPEPAGSPPPAAKPKASAKE
jgi:hypothetical protein